MLVKGPCFLIKVQWDRGRELVLELERLNDEGTGDIIYMGQNDRGKLKAKKGQ